MGPRKRFHAAPERSKRTPERQSALSAAQLTRLSGYAPDVPPDPGGPSAGGTDTQKAFTALIARTGDGSAPRRAVNRRARRARPSPSYGVPGRRPVRPPAIRPPRADGPSPKAGEVLRKRPCSTVRPGFPGAPGGTQPRAPGTPAPGGTADPSSADHQRRTEDGRMAPAGGRTTGPTDVRPCGPPSGRPRPRPAPPGAARPPVRAAAAGRTDRTAVPEEWSSPCSSS